MSIFWSYHSLGQATTVDTLKESIRSFRPVYIFLFETLPSSSNSTSYVCGILGSDWNYFGVVASERSRGLTLLLEKSVNV